MTGRSSSAALGQATSGRSENSGDRTAGMWLHLPHALTTEIALHPIQLLIDLAHDLLRRLGADAVSLLIHVELLIAEGICALRYSRTRQ